MNPLSPLTYYRRHKRRALLLLGLISLTTLCVCIVVRLLDCLVEQVEITDRYLARVSVVRALGSSLEPGAVSQIRAHPDVARVVPARRLYIGAPMNSSGGFPMFGVPEADAQYLMDTWGLRLKEGRLPRARTNEIALSEALAESVGLRIGAELGRSINENLFSDIPTTMVLVGILEDVPSASSGQVPSASSGAGPGRSVFTGIASYEYLDSHELYRSSRSALIVVAQEGHKATVDHFLETTISSPRTDVMTQRQADELLAQGRLFMRLLFGVADSLVALVIALVVGTIYRIGLLQRIEEFGLLHAAGYSRERLVRRLTLESIAVAGAGWIAGLALSWLVFVWVKASIFPPALELDLANLTPIWFSAPLPLAVVGFVFVGITRTFGRLDAVAIIERGKLGEEASGQRRAAKRSSPHPLSPWTFYLRHRRRGLALVAAMGLMTLAVAFPGFLFGPTGDCLQVLAEHLRPISSVSPRAGASLDPGVAAQIRTHPAAARAIPAIAIGLMIEMPPLSRNQVRIHGVSEQDLPALVNVYGVQLEEGRLPRPCTNEIVVSRSIATNRDLHVGDKVGRPAYEYDYLVPTEMVVVGILSRPLHNHRQGDIWTGFASSEYLQSHELYSSLPVGLLIVPAEGRKAELDAWLEDSVASEQTAVQTYETRLSESRSTMAFTFLVYGVVESVIAVVAAIALGALSYTFFDQRQEEFGILHAMGYSRSWLVRRTIGETAGTIGAAWLLAAVICGAGLLYIQLALYAPKALALNFFNPAPWLLTLPMPLAVVTVSAGLVLWMLARLDPVSIVERR